MEYRVLTPAEKSKVAEVFPKYVGQNLDDINVYGAVEDGAVKAFAVANLVPHCEPVYIEKGSNVDFRRLVKGVEALFQGAEIFIFVPNGHIARMAEIAGYQDTGWKAYRKEL